MKQLIDWKFRASGVGNLAIGMKMGLTDNQEKTLIGLNAKREAGKITDKQLITLGDLLAKKTAKPKLGQTGKSYCDKIIQEQVLKRSKAVQTKYFEKGIAVEEYSFNLLCEKVGKFLVKNEERFTNDWITGEPDCTQGKIRDIKSSFDCSTFPLLEDECKKGSVYWWQLQAYMWLTGIHDSELDYVLVDTPSSIVDDELRRLSWKVGALSVESMDTDLKVEKISNLIYTKKGLEEYCHQSSDIELDWFVGKFHEIPMEHRVKIFDVPFDPKAIEQMKTYISLARDYMVDRMMSLAAELDGKEKLTIQLEQSLAS